MYSDYFSNINQKALLRLKNRSCLKKLSGIIEINSPKNHECMHGKFPKAKQLNAHFYVYMVIEPRELLTHFTIQDIFGPKVNYFIS